MQQHHHPPTTSTYLHRSSPRHPSYLVLDIDRLCKVVEDRPSKLAAWIEVDVLVLDEVSMLSAELLTVLDFMARKLRHRPEPFGGIQLVLCGDFLQLPPVSGGQHSSFGKACAGLDSDGEGEEEEKGSEEELASDDENPPTHSQEEHRQALARVLWSLKQVREKQDRYAFKVACSCRCSQTDCRPHRPTHHWPSH